MLKKIITKEDIITIINDSGGGVTPDGTRIIKGTFNAGNNSFPGGSIKKGYEYIVLGPGTISGEDFQDTDSVYALVDDPSMNIYAGNWQKVDNTETDPLVFISITWEALVAFVGGGITKTGQRWNIEHSIDTTKDYGKIILDSTNQFVYIDVDGFEEIINIL